MRIFVYLEIILLISSAWAHRTNRCKKKYHYWRPFFGEHDSHDYVGAMTVMGNRVYIGKIISIAFKRSWTVSTQLTYDFVEFAWEDNKVRREYDFIEIMSIHPKYEGYLTWLAVQTLSDLSQMVRSNSYCLVEGGIVKYRKKIIYSYIGRVYKNGSFFIGPVYEEDWVMRRGMHYLDGWKKLHRKIVYQVLAYMY